MLLQLFCRRFTACKNDYYDSSRLWKSRHNNRLQRKLLMNRLKNEKKGMRNEWIDIHKRIDHNVVLSRIKWKNHKMIAKSHNKTEKKNVSIKALKFLTRLNRMHYNRQTLKLLIKTCYWNVTHRFSSSFIHNNLQRKRDVCCALFDVPCLVASN